MQYQFNQHSAPNFFKCLIRLLQPILLLVLWPTFSGAQNFPVQASLQIPSPHSLYLTDYTSPSYPNGIKVSLVLQDFNAQDIEVKLRFKIEGQGIVLETNLDAPLDAVTLSPGVPSFLQGADLTTNLSFQNLRLEGISVADLNRKGGRLPEGFYRVSVTAFVSRRGREIPVSRPALTTLWLTEGDPPLPQESQCGIDIPFNGIEKVINFNWLPIGIHPGQGMRIFNFSLYEHPQGRPVSKAAMEETVRGTRPIYQIESVGTQLSLSTSELGLRYDPDLGASPIYIWRVQVTDSEGRTVYKNDGFSKICYFKLVEENQEWLDKMLYDSLQFKVGALNAYMGYVNFKRGNLNNALRERILFRYRGADSRDIKDWSPLEMESNNGAVINQLAPDFKYEVQMHLLSKEENVQVLTYEKKEEKAQDDGLEWSVSKTFKTFVYHEQVCGEGSKPELLDRSNRNPLMELYPKQRIQFSFGNYMTITEVTNHGGGVFSGEGLQEIFGRQVRMAFDNLMLNEDLIVLQGEAYGKQESKYKDMIANIWQSEINRDREAEYDLNERDDVRVMPFVLRQGSISKVTVLDLGNGNQKILVFNKKGKSFNAGFPPGEGSASKKIIRDDKGNVYMVDDGGTVEKVSEGGDATGDLASGGNTETTKGKVNEESGDQSEEAGKNLYRKDGLLSDAEGFFAVSEGTDPNNKSAQEYLLDRRPLGQKPTAVYLSNYKKQAITKTYVSNGFGSMTKHEIAFKLKGLTVKLNDTSKLVFAIKGRKEKVLEYDNLGEGDEVIVDVSRLKNGTRVIAKLDGNVLEELAVVQYKKKFSKLELVMVSVDGETEGNIDTEDIQRNLRNIYGSGANEITVEREVKSIDISSASFSEQGFNVSGARGVSRYSKEMKLVSGAYKKKYQNSSGWLERRTFTLFVLPQVSLNKGKVQGFMPRRSRQGFVFNGGAFGSKVIAHELGHGIFGLEHPEGDVKIEVDEDNLMNQGGKSSDDKLMAHQWKRVAHPPSVLSTLGEKMEEGQDERNTSQVLKKIISLANQPKIDVLLVCKECSETSQEIKSIPEKSERMLEKSESIPGKIDSIPINGKLLKCVLSKIENGKIQFNIDESLLSTIYNQYKDFEKRERLINSLATQIKSSKNKGAVEYSFLINDDGSIKKVDSTYTYRLPKNFCDSFLLDPKEQDKIAKAFYNLDLKKEEIKNTLLALDSYSRAEQGNEYYENGRVYYLGDKKVIKERLEPLSDDDIQKGNWEGIGLEQLFRIHKVNGVLQIRSTGIRSGLEVIKNKEVNLVAASENVKKKGNALLRLNEVRRVEQKIKAKDQTNERKFPDGESIDIDTQAACFKVIYEASAIMKTLFSTGKIEKSVYLESTKGKVTIHGPPLLTGVIEGVSKEVTDLTSAGKMVYDLVVDEEVYEQTLEGMSSLKDEIGKDPSLGMKILAEGLLEETIGVGSEELNKLFTHGIDKGQKGHTISRATTGVVITAIAISEMAKMLPSIAKKMGKRVKFTKSFSRFKDVGKKIGKGTDELFKRVDELGDQGRKFLEDFADAPNETIKALLGNPRLVNSWEAVIRNPMIRKDIKTLESVNKILSNSNITSVINKSDLGDIVNKLAQKGVKCRICTSGNSSYKFLDEILDDIEFGVLKYGDDYSSVLTGFKQGGNFAEGAMFVASSMKKYPTTFPKGTLFEFTEVTVGGVRRVDVRVSNTFYEFKSVASNGLPPGGFANQFVKDLELADLSQIKWWFDGDKVTSLQKSKFLDELNSATIPQTVIEEILPDIANPTKANLLQKISQDFDQIFLVK